MALIKCPECGRENVSDSAKACPGCGFQIYSYFHSSEDLANNADESSSASTTNSASSKSNKSKTAKFVIIGLIVITAIWGIWYSSTRCTYSGCYEHKASSGNYCAYHKALLSSYSSYGYSSYNYDARSTYDLRISNVTTYTNSAASYCKGTIENNGKKAFKFVQVKGAFKDRNGNTIETGNTYAVGGEGLEPGESTSFEIYCERNLNIASCTVSVYDYD